MIDHPARPRLFIGSSSEGKLVADFLQAVMEQYCEAKVWDQGVFGLGRNTLQNLIDETRGNDFATLVLTADDLVAKRGKRRAAPRDNVLFELGLFMGALGLDRTFIVQSIGDNIDIPSDLEGITRATYTLRTDRNWRATLNPIA